MARRTKEEALATRHKLLDAAEHLFQEQGVSGTSLQDIARRAGATRGAIYSHFKDKADLFNAMMERVILPMEGALRHEGSEPEDSNSLDLIRQITVNAFSQFVNNSQTRRVFEVGTHKVEYVGELQAVRQWHLTVRNGFLSHYENHIDAAARQRKVKLTMPAAIAAQGFHALIYGLLQNWLLAPQAFDLLEVGQCAMNVYLVGLGFSAEEDLAAPPIGTPPQPRRAAA